jgi:broad specificity phosphatase PhoE
MVAPAARHDVVLVRHGQTEWSEERKHTGRTDVPLTNLGRDHAKALGKMLREMNFAAVLSSPLSRAWETMELAGFEGTPDDDLLEWDYGIYEGTRTVDTRKQIPGWSVWTHPIEGGESLTRVGERVDRVIDRVLTMDGPVALFAHAHVLRILAARWIELPPLAGRLFTFDTASVSILGWEREQRVVRVWNKLCGVEPMKPLS